MGKVLRGKTPIVRTGLKHGSNKGHITTPRAYRANVVRSVIREVAGFAPYEKRIQEILKGGGNNPTKRAVRFARNRLGSHIRAKKKIGAMNLVIEAAAMAEVKRNAEAKAAAAQ